MPWEKPREMKLLGLVDLGVMMMIVKLLQMSRTKENARQRQMASKRPSELVGLPTGLVVCSIDMSSYK